MAIAHVFTKMLCPDSWLATMQMNSLRCWLGSVFSMLNLETSSVRRLALKVNLFVKAFWANDPEALFRVILPNKAQDTQLCLMR